MCFKSFSVFIIVSDVSKRVDGVVYNVFQGFDDILTKELYGRSRNSSGVVGGSNSCMFVENGRVVVGIIVSIN